MGGYVLQHWAPWPRLLGCFPPLPPFSVSKKGGQRCPDVPSLGQAPLCLRVLSSSRIGRHRVHSGGQGRTRGARQSPPSSCPCRWRVLGGGGGRQETPGLAPACLLPLQVGDVAPFCPGAATEGLPPQPTTPRKEEWALKRSALLGRLGGLVG